MTLFVLKDNQKIWIPVMVIAAVLLVGCTTSEKRDRDMGRSVKREDTRIWIDYAVDIDGSCLEGLSHIYRIADVLRFYGVEADTDWLMGVSGEAFCYYYHPDGTFLSPFTHSWDSALAALEAVGFKGMWRYQPASQTQSALETIRTEIEAERPVIAPGIQASANKINSRCHYWFIVNGVDIENQKISLLGNRDDAKNFMALPVGDSHRPGDHPCWYGIVRTVIGADSHYGPSAGNNPLLLVSKGEHKADRQEVVIQALERAVKLAHEEPVKLSRYGGGTYIAGLAALERLLNDVTSVKGNGVDEFKKLNPTKGDPFGGVHEELVHLRLLSNRRQAAAGFLRSVVKILPAAAKPSVMKAAEKYDMVAQRALEAFILRHGPVEQNDRICEFARLEQYDDNPEWDAYWQRANENLADPARRKELAGLIARLLQNEKDAVAEMEQALLLLR
jgi:hypothetical protein